MSVAFLNSPAASKVKGKLREVRDILRRPPRDAVRAGNVVWIFGFGRSGTTWVANMLGDMEGHSVWPEPMVGRLFGEHHYQTTIDRKRKSHWYIMGPRADQRRIWLRLIRDFVLEMGAATLPEAVGENRRLVVKEPHGSMGAPLLMEALPESRMLVIVRDPRDVVSSWQDVATKGNWRGQGEQKKDQPKYNVANRANLYTQSITKSKEAYDAHNGRKSLIRYEDLRAEPMETMLRVCSELEIDIDRAELARIVDKHSWENVPGVPLR